MHALYRDLYGDFTVKHFHEQLVRRHGYKLCYTVTRLSLQAAGLVAKAKRRGAHRKKRARRPLPGMLLFQGGSTHRWIAALNRDLDLVVTLDDATGKICSAILLDQEGTMSSFLGLAETIGEYGLFSALYTDRGSHYFVTPKSGGKVDKTQLTPVGRALAQLGITHMASYSPQGRGRMERVFGTLQKRLPQELRLARIKTVAAANRYLKQRFVLDYNASFSMPAAEPGSAAFIRYVGRPIEDVLCIQEDRVVGADNASPGTGAACRFRLNTIVGTMCAPPCVCTNIPTAISPSSMARAVLHASTRSLAIAMLRLRPLNSARRSEPVYLWTGEEPAHKLHRPSSNSRSGHLVCYKARTSSRATDTAEGPLQDP